MNINDIIIYIMTVFAVLGAADRIIGNRFGLGEKFEEGIMSIATLSISMVGILVLAPVIADVLEPVVVPVFQVLGADPAMFVGSILANDMGGAMLAKEMALTKEAGDFAGLIVASMMGATVVFTIPTALGIVHPEDRTCVATGVLAGVVTIPIGAFIGGIAAGYSPFMIGRNLLPIIIFAVLIALGLWKVPGAILKGFDILGKGIVVLITAGLAVGIVEALTGWKIIPGANPIQDGFAVVADIVIVLAGAFPLVHVITKVCRKPLLWLGKMLGMNEVGAAGMVACLANSIPVFGMIKDMDERGKVINMAFAVSAAFVFGDHLGFTAGFAPEMIVPMIVGKLTGGVTAVMVALVITRKDRRVNNNA